MFDMPNVFEMRADALWVGITMLIEGFLVAAQSHPWMWAVLLVVAITATRKAWLKLGRFVGGAFVRQQWQ